MDDDDGGGGGQRGRRRRRRALAAGAASGMALASAGAVLALFWPALFQIILQKELALTPTSTSFRMWKETPVPLFLEFYFFNWTNPEEMDGTDPDYRPHFVEVGPYVFREVHEKVGVQWHPNATITYRRVRRWYFDTERSGGTLHDNITTLNVIALSAAYNTRESGLLWRKSLSLSMASLGQLLHETHTAAEILFDGFTTPLLALANAFPSLSGVPFDRFAWFYQRNGSEEADGLFTMHTGADDLALLGRLSRWNGADRTAFFPGPCGRINGSAGELFPPGPRRDRPVVMFSNDLCRSLEYRFSRESAVHGVAGLRFSAGYDLVSNREGCFCGGGAADEGPPECAPPGSFNVSSCRGGAPAFVSYPHFYLAHPDYLQAVSGLAPDPGRHENFITLEPITGLPLEVAARFQINILLQPYPSIGLLKDVPKIYFPMLWFQEHVTMTPELANNLKILLFLPSGGVIMAAFLIITGSVILAATVLCWMKTTLRWQPKCYHADIPLKTPAPPLIGGREGGGVDGGRGASEAESALLRPTPRPS